MSSQHSSAYYLKPLAIDFANDKLVEEKELAKNRNWKKLIKLPTIQRYEVVLIALRGLVQRRNPGFDNSLWALIVTHELDYMLNKGNKQFLFEVAEEIKKVRDINTLPFTICWDIVLNLKKHDFDSCLSVLLRFFQKKYEAMNNPSEDLQSFMKRLIETFRYVENTTADELQEEISYLQGSFDERKNQSSNIGTYFVDSHDSEVAWHKLDANTKETIQNYENDLFYDRSPKPSHQQKEQTIEAVQNSKLNKKHKKALIENIKKKS